MAFFQRVCSITTRYGHTIDKFRSVRTGLSVVLGRVEGPLVHGNFALATEAFDDDGCPHTLEHLVFLGSEDYPYKGVLDRVANRSLAQGTNAWTDTDHTCYTISTAGHEGFLSVLPAYLDHILYPTLTDAGCYTEVHHINGEGENAGVVYSEMQGRENSADDRLHYYMNRMMYPEGCGYRSNTGGMMTNLRSLQVETIRQYHRDYYRPDNLCLIVTGSVPSDALLSALNKYEEKITRKGPLAPMKRPWVDSAPVPPFKASVTQVVEFPEEDESVGEVYLAWHGPHYAEFSDRAALELIWTYLSDSPVAVLQKQLVDKSLCTDVSFAECTNIETLWYVNLSSVPAKHLHTIHDRLFKALRDHFAQGIDLERMALIIDRERLKTISQAETNPHEFILNGALSDFLYGTTTGSQLEAALDFVASYEECAKWTADQWASLFNKYFLERPHGTLIGKPSKALSKKIADEEAERVTKQRETLGKEKLAELAGKLAEAKATNEAPFPADVITKFAVPGVESISMVPVKTSRRMPNETGALTDVQLAVSADTPSRALPFDIQFDHVPSAFVELAAYIDTAGIPLENRLNLELLLEVFFETPIMRDGVLLTHENVVEQLERDTISVGSSIGLGGKGNFSVGAFGNLLEIGLKVEASKYEKGVQWLHDLLHAPVYDPKRLLIAAKKLHNDIPVQKREGMPMARVALLDATMGPESNHAAVNIVRQTRYLSDTIKELETNPDAVIQRLNTLRTALLDSSRMRVHVIADVLKMSHPRMPWLDRFGGKDTTDTSSVLGQALQAPVLSHAFSSEKGRSPSNDGILLSMPSIESAFSIHVGRGPATYTDKDIPALFVLGEYLSMMESVFWKQVRGQGLAYGCGITPSIDHALLYFSLSRSPDCFKAYRQVKQITQQLASGELTFDEDDLAAAKCGVIFSAISRESNWSEAARQNFINVVLKGLGKDPVPAYLERVKAVTTDDLRAMLLKYVCAIFEPETSLSSIATAAPRAKELVDNFATIGVTLTAVDGVDKLIPGWEAYAHADGEEDDDESGKDDESGEDDEDGSESEEEK